MSLYDSGGGGQGRATSLELMLSLMLERTIEYGVAVGFEGLLSMIASVGRCRVNPQLNVTNLHPCLIYQLLYIAASASCRLWSWS